MIEEEVIASVMVPRKTKNGIKKFRKDIKYVMGKNKMLYRVAQDEKGRTFMVDANGVLFYDSGIKKVGWYAVSPITPPSATPIALLIQVEPGGEITNFYADGGKVRYKALGNISNLRVFKINEFMGLEIDPIKIAAFSDEELKPLPPNTPLVKSAKSGNVSDHDPFGSFGHNWNRRRSFSSFRHCTLTKAESNWKRDSHSILLPAEMEGESLDEKMIEEMIKGEEETAPRVMGPIEILAQLESDMESLLNAVDGQSIANESAAQFDDHVQQLKEQLAVKRQDPASVLRQVRTDGSHQIM